LSKRGARASRDRAHDRLSLDLEHHGALTIAGRPLEERLVFPFALTDFLLSVSRGSAPNQQQQPPLLLI
jgi:hypothetical protein